MSKILNERPRMIGLCGSHRTGKTSLMLEISKQMGINSIATSSSGVFKRLGLDPSTDLNVSDRISAQEAVFDQYIDDVMTNLMVYNGSFVVDRTPIDMIGYLKSDKNKLLHGHSIYSKRVDAYLRKCLNTAKNLFTDIILIEPAIPVVEESMKGNCSREAINALNEHIKATLSLNHDSNLAGVKIHYLPVEVVDMSERVKWCVDVVFNQNLDGGN